MQTRKTLLRVVRFAAAGALLVLVLSRAHWNDYQTADPSGVIATYPGILTCLRNVDPLMFILSIIVSTLALVVAALRWRMLLRIQDVVIGAGESIKLGFIGESFSAIIPGMISGDAVKAYYVVRSTQRKGHVLASVIVDRMMGICGLVLFSWVALFFLGTHGGLNSGSLYVPAASAGVVTIGLLGGAAFLLSSRLRRVLHLDRLYQKLPFAKHVAAAGDAIRAYRQSGRRLVPCVVLTAVAQILGVAFVFFIGSGLGLDLPWCVYFAYVPLIMMISAIPVTPGAIGVMEGLYLLYFGSAGSPDTILALAILIRAVLLCGALPGVGFLAVGPPLPSGEDVKEFVV
ncbi:MAG: lysylphosphatidylglycerol synthase transmembrane domain-containing protein [Kiritimatiellia bacterium]|jgi:hypothetical protein|nr:lysylphosphatidylglycerol synthase transmembrane domain-containing protein [Kiritimatiellia bacterium]MDP6849199.1 lysylphosphatidylglycerol synthase transmembrane domain-containing protein [Kiritimatiellia bacterium]